MHASLLALACAAGCLAAPARRAAAAADLCFVVGSTTLPAETLTAAEALADVITCSTTATTIANVPDVTAGNVSFSQINFAAAGAGAAGPPPLAFALDRFATASPLASNDLAVFQDRLDTYLATEAGVRSVGGSLAIKVPKFFLAFQVARIQTAQGRPPTDAASTVDHLLQKVLTNAAGQGQDLLDQVTALSKVLA